MDINIIGRRLKIETSSQTQKSIHDKQRSSTPGIGQPVPGKGRPPQAIVVRLTDVSFIWICFTGLYILYKYFAIKSNTVISYIFMLLFIFIFTFIGLYIIHHGFLLLLGYTLFTMGCYIIKNLKCSSCLLHHHHFVFIQYYRIFYINSKHSTYPRFSTKSLTNISTSTIVQLSIEIHTALSIFYLFSFYF